MTTENDSSTQEASSLHSLVGWLNRRSHRKLKERLVELEAHEKVWALTVEGDTNSYFIERLAQIRGELAVVRERIARTQPPNDVSSGTGSGGGSK